MEETKRDRKKEKQKTDETRNNLGKAWVAYKGVCAGSLQEFVNHLLAVHELYCHNSRDRQRAAKLAEEEGEDLEEEGETARARSPENRNSRPSRDDQSSAGSHSEDHHHHHHHHHAHHSADPQKSDTSTHSEGSHPSRRTRLVSHRSKGQSKSVSRSRSRSLSRPRQPVRRSTSYGIDQGNSDSDGADGAEAEASGSGANFSHTPMRGVCVTGLPLRSSDTNLKDGLYHKFKKHGKVQSVHITGEGETRFAVVSFQRTDEAKKTMAEADRVFFGSQITVALHEGFASQPESGEYLEPDCSEYHAKATRTLFVRNLEEEIRVPDLREIFKAFGEILDIDIKRQNKTNYAFIQYTDIVSVVQARREMDGKMIGALQIQTGFGKSLPSKCVWLDNVAEQVTDKYLCQKFSRYGPVTESLVDNKGKALVFFEAVDAAQYAVNEMRNRVLFGKKIMIDFASQVCEQAFISDMERAGGMVPGRRAVARGQRTPAGFSGGRDGYGPPMKPRQARVSGGDQPYGYNNLGQPPAPSRSMAAGSRNSTTGGSFGGRTSQGAGNRATGFSERVFPQETETRDRRQGYYSDYGPEGGPYRENSFEDTEYNYRKQDPRSVSPPRKRRMLQGEVRNSRPPAAARETDVRYSKQYGDQYQSPLQRDRRDSATDPYAHFPDSDNPMASRPTGRTMRSFHNEPHREYRQPAYNEKSETKPVYSPPQSSSDFTQRSPSPSADEL